MDSKPRVKSELQDYEREIDDLMKLIERDGSDSIGEIHDRYQRLMGKALASQITGTSTESRVLTESEECFYKPAMESLRVSLSAGPDASLEVIDRTLYDALTDIRYYLDMID